MSVLILGVIIWSAAHLFKAVWPARRRQIERRVGARAYRGVFSIIIVGSLILVVIGWRSADPFRVYAAPLSGGPVISLLVLAALILFFASQFPGNVRRLVRHPQMTGTVLWGVAHLLTNGDSRSVVLFGGLTAWALLEVTFINRRDGAWQKPGPAAIKYDIFPIAIGFAAFAALLLLHRTLFGVAAY